MRQLSPDPLSLAADAIGAGASLLIVTLAAKGAAYVAAPGFDGWAEAADAADTARRSVVGSAASPDRSDPRTDHRRPGSHRLRRRLRGGGGGPARSRATRSRTAIRHANTMAARNAAFRGAGGLSRHLRGELVTP